MRLADAAALMLLLSGAARAEESVTWPMCVEEAARANPDLSSSRLSVDARRASYYGSFNRFLPAVSLSNSVSESSSSRSPAWSAGANASVTLFSAGDAAAIRSASASLSAAEASLRRSSAELRSSLRQAFSSLMFAQASLEAARRIRELRAHNADLVNLRYESGRESKGSRMRAQAQALQAEVQLANVERDLRASQRDLGRRVGREEFSSFVASGTFASAPPPPRPDDFRALLPLRPDLAVAEASVRSSRAALDQSRSTLWPSLSANYSRTRFGETEFPSRRYAWSAGATLSYPLFGGGPTATYFSAVSGKRGLESAQADLASTRQAALSDLESAWAAYAGAADSLRAQDALLEAARQRNDEADIRYASGLLSFDNWEVIVSDRVATERQAVSARRAAMDAETAWDRALGRALGE